MLTANPELLVLARLSRGESGVAAADALGVSSGLLSKWENGVATPPPERLSDLASHYRYPEPLFLQGDRVRGSDSVCFHHRKQKSMPARLLNRIEARMFLAQIQVQRLLRHIEIDAPLEFVTMDPDEHGGPAKVAQHLRAYWRVPIGPIKNLVWLIESAGGIVMYRDFGTRKLDGMSSWPRDAMPLFFVNQTNPTDRSRWTIAHELGHLVMHGSPTSGHPEEEANAFAQEFLMPRDQIESDLRRLSFTSLPSLKNYWRVSMKVLITSADHLGVIPPGRAKSLYVQYSRAGFAQGEPWPLDAETPSLIRDAISVHLNQHRYSIQELAGVMLMYPDEFVAEYDVPTGGTQMDAMALLPVKR